ncbi:SIR2 family protein [Chryseolinea lacunae]|uniref:SIR2 family protein n=1 Tax=Chryseolinea lacunae TaxID=2801331 RepID=A0ABS1KP19_9BACT|nr:SIR2 family protein [Chryseolinea lacunae]MBL0741080.1 SIR2 family protein [Chryseolinea lacunae]
MELGAGVASVTWRPCLGPACWMDRNQYISTPGITLIAFQTHSITLIGTRHNELKKCNSSEEIKCQLELHSKTAMAKRDASSFLFETLGKDSTAILCGAGVSSNSGIPSVGPFVKYVLSKLDMDVVDIARLKEAELPFEALMEQIGRSLPIENLLDVFNVDAPNRTHKLLVSLIKGGICNIIYTTNFDTNIELAASQYQVGLTVASLPRQLELSEVNVPLLVKLHGTIQDKSKLGVTIRTIADKQYIQGLEDWIKYLLIDGPHKNILVLGYSFSDRFDIGPLMQKYASQSKKSMFNIEYDPANTADELESIVRGELKYDQLRIDTDQWINNAFKKFGVDDPGPNPVTPDGSFHNLVDKWVGEGVTNKGVRNKFTAVVKIFQHVGLGDLVIKYATRGIASGLLDADSLFGLYTAKAQALNNYRHSPQQLQESLLALESAVYYCTRSGRPDTQDQLMFLTGTRGTIYGSIAYKHTVSGSKDATKYYVQAKEFLTKSVEYFEARMSDFVSKDRYFGFVLDLAVACRRSGESDRATGYYDKIVKAYEGISDLAVKQHLCVTLYNYGAVYLHRANFPKALEYFTSALRNSIEIGMQPRALTALRESIFCLRKLGHNDEAEALYSVHPYPIPPFEYFWLHEINLEY